MNSCAARWPATPQPQSLTPPPVLVACHPQRALSASARSVYVNGVPLCESELHRLDALCRRLVADGRYWYDAACGWWGLEGEARSACLPAGLDFGGPLHADASRGQTRVFINGRQLGMWELLRTPGIPLFPRRRYWVNARGDYGIEGQPAMGNLQEMADKAAALGQIAIAAQFLGALGNSNAGQHGSCMTSWDRTGVAVYPMN